MKKLLIVPAILAMSAFSGSALAQRTTSIASTQGANTATSSPVAVIGSPQTQTNIAVPLNISVLTSNNNQNNSVGQGNLGTIGIGSTGAGIATSR